MRIEGKLKGIEGKKAGRRDVWELDGGAEERSVREDDVTRGNCRNGGDKLLRPSVSKGGKGG